MLSFTKFLFATILTIGVLATCASAEEPQNNPNGVSPMEEKSLMKATFGSGCFWCTEAVFQQLNGVTQVVSGYAGGEVDNPTYEQVCAGTTGHAEVIQVTYDPEQVSFETLLEVFWKTHDPTTLNRQGNDVGTQYRSVVMYHDEEQKALAEKYRDKLEEAKVFDDPIVTEIVPASQFFPAEKYHQNYYNQNQNQPYCQVMIAPKLKKLRAVFAEKLNQ